MIGDWLLRFLGWGVRKIGRQTLVTWLLLGLLVTSLAAGLGPVVREVDSSLLLILAASALFTGWILGHPRLDGRFSLALLFFTGLGFVLLQVGQLASQIFLLIRAANRLALDLLAWVPGAQSPDFTSLISSIIDLLQGCQVILLRGWDWFFSLMNGEPGFDPVGALLFWSLLVWSVVAWAAWNLRRSMTILLAVLPAGILLGSSLAAARAGEAPLLLFLATTLLLMGWTSASRRQWHWEQEQMDYSEDLSVDIGISVVLLVLTLTVTASLAPMFSLESVREFFDSYRLRQQDNEAIPQSLGLEVRPEEEISAPRSEPADPQRGMLDELRRGGMPREHLIGSGPELSEMVVMQVRTGDLPPLPPDAIPNSRPPRYYWRSLAYDIYTGSGWATSSTLERRHPAEDVVFSDQPPAQKQLVHTIREVADLGGLLFLAGELQEVDREVLAFWRRYPGDEGWAEMDLFGAAVQGDEYQVRSLMPLPSVEQLKSSGAQYPDWVRSRFLQLPKDLPAGVLGLARRLTATQPDAFERAAAIQDYLRRFPYNLDTALPPADRDVVDYFLFDLQEGYCDYFATAMVVLARAAGIPARLAIGYVGGNYNYLTAEYTIVEAQAHSWPEVYFPDYGWVIFEPTSGIPAIQRGQAAPPAASPTENEPESGWLEAVPWRPILLMLAFLTIAALVIFLAWVASEPWRLGLLSPQQALEGIYRRMYRSGKGLGVSASPGSTPAEFSSALRQFLRQERLLNEDGAEVEEITGLYTTSLYSPRQPGRLEQMHALQLWSRLHWRLRFAKLSRLLHRVRKRSPESISSQ